MTTDKKQRSQEEHLLSDKNTNGNNNIYLINGNRDKIKIWNKQKKDGKRRFVIKPKINDWKETFKCSLALIKSQDL